jgi:DNA-binding IclR family transcriptional regulator
VTDVEEYIAQLRAARERGYTISTGERVREGTGVAAPILASNGNVLGVIAILAPAHRTPEAKLYEWAPLAQQAAQEIAVAFGAQPPRETRAAKKESRSKRHA